jgi:1-acyl-sn-glycerol-3-phosphate acyltransferase
VLLWLFRLYLRYLFWRKFHAIRLAAGTAPPPFAGRPLVIYCNHPSWWDPALILLTMPRLFPRRRGFGPMDAAELERYGLFRRMGLFGIDPTSPRGAASFLRVARAGLAHSDTMLGITAEGSFTDPRLRPVRLRAGLAHLARHHPEAVFLPLALEYGFWNESKPEALLRFGRPVQLPPGNTNSVAEWQVALEAALTETMDALADASAQRDPAMFTRLFSGTAGVGGIYDLWRRARAAAAGRRFNAQHEPGGD